MQFENVPFVEAHEWLMFIFPFLGFLFHVLVLLQSHGDLTLPGELNRVVDQVAKNLLYSREIPIQLVESEQGGGIWGHRGLQVHIDRHQGHHDLQNIPQHTFEVERSIFVLEWRLLERRKHQHVINHDEQPLACVADNIDILFRS